MPLNKTNLFKFSQIKTKITYSRSNQQSYHKNYLKNRYLLWNKLYHPFNSFDSLPFEHTDTNHHKFASSFDEEFQQISLKYKRRLYTNFTKTNNTNLTSLDNFKLKDDFLGGNHRNEEFTIVMIIYKRVEFIINHLLSYLEIPHLNKFIIIWNDVESHPDYQFYIKYSTFLISNKLFFIIPEKNSLNNRFVPYDIIETEAILIMDDDTRIERQYILFGFKAWRQNRDRLVGIIPRTHSWDFNNRSYYYNHRVRLQYSIILPTAFFYHNFYNYAYTYLMDEKIRSKVDMTSNCDDIAINFLISHYSRQPPLKITRLLNYKYNLTGLSNRLSHYSDRTDCIQYFISIYGYNPLLYSQYSAVGLI